jgi:hypothetical protein
VSQKLGNFSSPTLIKQCAKYNRGRATGKADAKIVAESLNEDLNRRLEEEESGIVQSEVLRFEHVNGFLNIYLQNEQFMDRV